jgi:hypothetical protein
VKRSRAVQSVLDQYRQVRAPDGAARERMQRGIAQRIASGEPSSVLVQEAPRLPPSAAGVAVSPSLLVGLGIGVCALLWVVFWMARTRETHASHVEPARAAQSSAQPRAPAASSPELAGSAASPATAESIPLALPSVPRQPSQRARSRNAAATAGRKSSPPDAVPMALPEPLGSGPATPNSSASVPTGGSSRQGDLEAEMRLLRAAYDALRAGHPERALETLAEHASRYPHGELAEARGVARIMALCQAKRVAAARSEAERFLQRSPSSPYAARVRSLCVGSQP